MTTTRRALVTGGSGDIGGAICRQLATDGCHVIVHGRDGLDATCRFEQSLCYFRVISAHFWAFAVQKCVSTKNFKISQFGDCRAKPMRIRLSWLEAFSS